MRLACWMTLVLIIRIQVRQSNPPQISLYLSKFILIALRTLKNFTFLLMGDLCLKLFFSNEIHKSHIQYSLLNRNNSSRNWFPMRIVNLSIKYMLQWNGSWSYQTRNKVFYGVTVDRFLLLWSFCQLIIHILFTTMLSGNRLKQFRLARGMSLEVLANATGGVVTKQSLSKYERGLSLPSFHVIEKLSEVLDLNIENLYRPEFGGYLCHRGIGDRFSGKLNTTSSLFRKNFQGFL